MQAPPPAPARWQQWLLGTEPRVRARVAQQLLAIGLGAGATSVFLLGVEFQQAPRWWVGLLLGAAGALALVGYAMVRSGWSERFADPSLTAAQISVSIALGCGAYPLLGAQRALVIPLLVLVLAFGLFPLRGHASLRLAVLALIGLALASAVGLGLWPGNWRLRDEVLHWVTAAISFLGMGLVADRVRVIRTRLTEQRAALNAALARIESLAQRDALTGLYHRGEGDARLRAALSRHRRTDRPLQVALLDLDHFKRINDQHGHAAGDAVLRAFARDATAHLRSTDTLARWGGEEFLLLLDDASPAQAREVLERMLAELSQRAVGHAGGTLHYTFSAGIAQAWPHDSPEQAVERADAALYRAKAAGRARVELA